MKSWVCRIQASILSKVLDKAGYLHGILPYYLKEET